MDGKQIIKGTQTRQPHRPRKDTRSHDCFVYEENRFQCLENEEKENDLRR